MNRQWKKLLNFQYKPFDVLFDVKLEDFVHVTRQKKEYCKGTVKNFINDSNSKFDQHFQVLLPDDLLLSFKPKRLTVVEKEPLNIILCPETKFYRNLAKSQVLENERVLEIGCDFGLTTNFLSKGTNQTFGIDKSYYHIKEAQKTFPHIKFFHYDVLAKSLTSFGKFDRVFIDVGGDRDYQPVEEVIKKVIQELNPSQIYVKNRQLYLRNKLE